MTANDAGTAVKSHPQKNESIARTRLQMAAGAVRGAGLGAEGAVGGII
jgi:hypothetical protein